MQINLCLLNRAVENWNYRFFYLYSKETVKKREAKNPANIAIVSYKCRPYIQPVFYLIVIHMV